MDFPVIGPSNRFLIPQRDRRWPLIFLWPKVFFVLRTLKGPPSESKEKKERKPE